MQLFLNILLSIYFLVFDHTSNVAILVILVFSLFLNIFRKNKIIGHLNQLVGVVALSYVFQFNLFQLAEMLMKVKISETLVLLLYVLTSLVVLLPVTFVSCGTIKNNWLRILALITVILTNCIIPIPNFENLPQFNRVIGSGLITSIALVIAMILLIKQWGFSIRPSIKFKKSPNLKWWVLISVLVFTTWFVFFSQFVDIAQNWAGALWNWDMRLLDPNPFAISSAISAAISEEFERYVLILLLLVIFKKSKYQLTFTICLSSFFWAIGHYLQLMNPNSSFYIITLKNIMIWGMGCLFAAVYLYCGRLEVLIILHFILDFIAYSTPEFVRSSSWNILGRYANGLVETAVLTLIPLLVTFILLKGKNKKVLEENAMQLIS